MLSRVPAFDTSMFHDTVWAVDMFDRTSEGTSGTVSPSVSLEYGDDHSTCNDKEFEISERGMCFKSRWRFEVGTQLAVSFSYCAGGLRQQVEAEAVVADCDPAGSECHQIILLFLEMPENLRAAIRD